ncbi:MAG: DUF4153 domain-containing protein [Clostridia bacterium]|jgi:hypothetical protein
MKILLFFRKLSMDLYLSIKRFPVAIFLSIATAVLLIFINHIQPSSYDYDFRILLQRLAMVVSLGIPVALCIDLFFERRENTKWLIKLISYLVAEILLILYFNFLLTDLSMVSVTRFIAIFLVAILVFMFVPYFLSRDFFEIYVIKLFTRSIITGIFTIVLFGGIALILLTLDRLLEIRIEPRTYFDVWVLCLGLFASCFFFSGIPEKSKEFSNENYPNAFRILVLYIIMPIVSVYTAILYIYFAKILITNQWPNGLVANLVLWYGAIGTIIIFFVSTLNNLNKWVKIFIFWFPKIIIPLLIMMFVSIAIRVNAYGVTELRYFAIMLGLWVFGLMIYLNFSKKKRGIIFVISLALIALISVSGPLSSYSVSMYSQNSRFENILNKYKMISDNKIVPAKTTVSSADKTQIEDIVSYFSSAHRYSDMKYLPVNFNIYVNGDFKKTFGFALGNDGAHYSPDTSTYYDYSSKSTNEAYNIEGYDDMILLSSDYANTTIVGSNGITAKYNSKDHLLQIYKNNALLYEKSVAGIIDFFNLKFGTTNREDLNPSQASIIFENSKISGKIIVQGLHAGRDSNIDPLNIYGFQSIILVRLKT